MAASPAAAQSWQSEYTWRTVGAAGNRAATAQEAPLMPGIGAVGYEYRMAQVPVTVGQYFEFVQAYLPYYQSSGVTLDFTGDWIYLSPQGTLVPPQQEWLHRPATPSWENAARFVNWLHNGKVNEAWAFESGVYDTSTFTSNGGVHDHVATPGAGATVWMPTLDEWTKAFHYDPSRHGEGQDGYWMYPHASDTPPVPGLPRDGGETDAGSDEFTFTFQDVGVYPWADSPWGLLDASGGENEWTSTQQPGSGRILYPDSARGDTHWWFNDRLDEVGYTNPAIAGRSFRLVIPVPGPSVLPAFVVVGLYSHRRKGRNHAEGARGGDRDDGRRVV